MVIKKAIIRSHAMHLVPVNELKSPCKLRARLESDKELLLTNNGKPAAIILGLEPGEDPEDLLNAAREARSRQALTRIREAARNAGSDKMTGDQVETLVAKVRQERKGTP